MKAPLLAGSSDNAAHQRDGQAISTLSIYWVWATVAPFLAWGSVQTCDDCGLGLLAGAAGAYAAARTYDVGRT